ncbi:hypothetical protein SPRG_05127 [Saprolegnia parasitica CBS 223.65]|uniref:Uncharacterized protein n=1 Tax=Saprolegnia parasitica (strain CBS 223.65) TaxID=695850 RepID=A0A067CT13_SAPPC|nr:hypothetical protein SPRG_05127 [Saprolegnia parasitica CBS 223.65]KDO29937.1 hypothetical protein SPRG_05127 [Saprolegnia parasitica CBS 223.65]|eukprot:XP_012199121.1 hypothetical protein SPRG_05127 [Saprolegnia parasitica CBS 223.65]
MSAESAFVDAAACGDLDEVKALLASTELTAEIINKVDKDGKSAFHYACLNDDAKLLAILLADPRVDVRQTSKNNDTGMHMAALYASLEAIALLHADGRVDINAQNAYGETPLHLCAGSGDKSAAKTANVLLANGALLSVTDKWNRGPKDVSHDNAENPIVATFNEYLADRSRCSEAELEKVQAISAAYRAETMPPPPSVNDITKKVSIFGLGGLGQVKLKKTTTVLKTMFKADEGTTFSGRTTTNSDDERRPLSKLIDFPGDLEEIRLHLTKTKLLSKDGVNPAGADAYGLTALHKFASWNKSEYLNALIPYLTMDELNAVCPEGKTALHYAVEMASAGAVKTLVAAGADVNAVDGKGRTVAMILDQATSSGVIDRLRNALQPDA